MWAWLGIAAHINHPIFKNLSQKAEVKTTFVRDQTFCTHSADGTIHGTVYMNGQSPTTLHAPGHQSHKHRIALLHKGCSLVVACTSNSLYTYCLCVLNPRAALCSILYPRFTPTLSMYTINSIQSEGQPYTAVQNSHRNGTTTESHKQLRKV